MLEATNHNGKPTYSLLEVVAQRHQANQNMGQMSGAAQERVQAECAQPHCRIAMSNALAPRQSSDASAHAKSRPKCRFKVFVANSAEIKRPFSVLVFASTRRRVRTTKD